jgi:signal transduction histidine kinase
MRRRINRKWRPPLGFVIGGTLAAVLGLPLVGITYFRLAGNILGWAETAWLIGLIALAATAILAFLLWRLVLQPVSALSAYARAVAEGRMDEPAPEHFGTPEFSLLAQSVIDMGTALHAREVVLRTYADHVTHELKSPLTVMRGAAELLDSPKLSRADRKALLLRIDQATDRMTALLDAQRALARAQEPRAHGRCNLSALAAGLERDFPTLQLTVTEDATLPMAVAGIRLVLEHLLANAVAHGATAVRLKGSPDGLIVADNGPGISDGNRARIFDPFFTTRRDEGGTGMGLPIVRRMLQAHGADIRLLDGPGAVFEIAF